MPATPPVLMVATEIPAQQVAPVVAQQPKIHMLAIAVEAPQFEISDDIPVAMVAPADASGCALGDAVQAALAGSPAVKTAVGLVAASARSVAGATLLWDGNWIDMQVVGGDQVLEPIKAVVIATVRVAPAQCRDTPVTGPRLAFVPDTGGTRILAFGSGTWKWSQLVEDSRDTVANGLAKRSQSK